VIMRPFLPALLVLALSGCIDGLNFGPGAGGTDSANDGLTRQVTAPGSGIVLAGPPGYCLDAGSSGITDPAAFAAFRRCEVLRGENFALARRALLTVSISGD